MLFRAYVYMAVLFVLMRRSCEVFPNILGTSYIQESSMEGLPTYIIDGSDNCQTSSVEI